MGDIALPDKQLIIPGQERTAIGSGIANGKVAILIQIEGQPIRTMELDFENAVALANGVLSAALEVKRAEAAKASHGSILQANGSGEVAR